MNNDKQKVRIIECEYTGKLMVVYVDKDGHVRQYALKNK